MEKTRLQLEVSQDGQLLGWVYSQPKTSPNAVILICHGMAEHIKRYESFCRSLANRSYAVVAYDQRGHGQSLKKQDDIGYMSDIHNFDILVSDLHEMYNHVKELFPKVPIVLLGHSMGSFVAQRFIEIYGVWLHGVVLSGSNLNKGFKLFIGRLLAKAVMKKNGRRYKSQLIHNLSFASFNKPFKPNRTDYDWLTRDNEIVDHYVNDPYCGSVFSVSYYLDLISGFKTIYRDFELVPADLPIYIFSGTDDPVGNFGKGVKALYKKYKDSGCKCVTLRLYEDGRHEMLNEINKDEVYQDLLKWLANL